MGIVPTQIYKRVVPKIKIPWRNINTWKRHPEKAVIDNPPVPTKKSPETQGMEEYAKAQTIRIANEKHKVDDLVRKSNRSVITISSTFPWNIFPNTIDVEEGRVTFIFRQFLTSQTHSVDIKDISNVFIESGFFFATLQVVSRTFVQNDIKINYLDKYQAIKVKSVIEALRTFNHNNIDTSNYEVKELVEKLSELHVAR
jgi:hypothetical protein